MDAASKDALMSLGEQQLLMIEQLHQFCKINSGTENLAGLAAMHDTLSQAFSPIADTIETHSPTPVATINMFGEQSIQACGNALFVSRRPKLKQRILLVGHMDTVYPKDSAFQELTQITDNHLNGPGVADMKGGLVVMINALKAFEKTSLAASLGWDVLINADEETGSLASSALIEKIIPNYQAALVYEPTINIAGSLARNRKGNGKMTLIATGVSAHAGRAFYEGRNAICYLAEAIMHIHALNGKRDGVTINVGKIAGGSALNVVPDKAVVKLDVRISQPEDEHWVVEQLNMLLKQMKRDDYSLTMHGSFDRPVKMINSGTTRLFNRIQDMGQQIGLTINWEDSGGCCDGNNLARYGLPVIDTLGVRGGAIHSHDEFILLDSLVERASLSTLLLMDLAKGGFEASGS